MSRKTARSPTPGVEAAGNLVQVVAATVDQADIHAALASNRVDGRALGALTVDGVEDHQPSRVEAALQSLGDLGVGAIPDLVVRVDVDGETRSALDPVRKADAEIGIDVAAADEDAAGVRVQPSRRGGLAGGRETAHHHDGHGPAQRLRMYFVRLRPLFDAR
jgi:hypothetical protein